MGQISTELKVVEKNIKQTGKNDAFKQQQEAVLKYNSAVFEGIKVAQRIQGATSAYKTEAAKLSPILANLTKQQKEFAAAGKYAELQRELKLTTQQTDELRKALEAANKEGSKQGRNSKGQFTPGSGSKNSPILGGGVGGIASGLGSLAATAGIAITAEEALRKVITTWADYGKVLSEVSAITGLTGKNLQYLDDQAKQLEADTGIAGTEILKAFQNIGSIAPALLENKELLAATTKEVVALSQASGLSLPDAAKAALGALNQFGEGADQAARYVNVLAAGALKGASEVTDTAEALKNAGTSMKAAGLSFEQGNALIQVLASTMIKGGEAGTGLRNVLLKLETATDKNLRPSVVGLDKALESASKKYNNTTELSKAFGVENINVARQVIENRSEIEKLTTAITGTGVAYEQQRIATDNLYTDLQKAGSGITAFIRSIGEEQDGMLRRITQSFTTFIQSLASKSGTLRALVSNTLKEAVNPSLGGSGVDIFAATKEAYDRNRAGEAQKAAAEKLRKETLNQVQREIQEGVKLYQDQGQSLATAQRSAAAKVAQARTEEIEQVRTDIKKFKEAIKGKSAAQNAAGKADADALLRRAQVAAIASKKANQEVARLAKIDLESKRARELANGEKAAKTDEEKAAEREAKKAQAIRDNINKLQLKADTDYQEAITKLEDEFGKNRLEALDKNSETYITEKAKFDKRVIETERTKLETLYQLAQSNQVSVINGERKIIPNKDAKLPAAIDARFKSQTAQVDVTEGTELAKLRAAQNLQLLEYTRQFDKLEVEQVKQKWDEIIKADKTGSKERLEGYKQQDIERVKLTQAINQIQQSQAIQLAFIDTKQGEEGLRANAKEQGELIVNLEKLKQEARFKVIIQTSTDLIQYLKATGEKENALLITQTQLAIDAAKKAQSELSLFFKNLDYSSSSGFLGSLLGFGGEDLDNIKLAADQISNVITSLTALQVEESQKRIDAIQAEIDAKQQQVDEEKDRAKDGYANNYDLRQKELTDLKAQKAAAQEENKKAVEKQQELDRISVVSSNAVTIAKLIEAAVEQFTGVGKIPFLGIPLALAAIATIYGTITSLKSKANTSIKLRTGTDQYGLQDSGFVGPNGRSHEQGGHRIDGTNIEVEGGEFVGSRASSLKFGNIYEAVNKGKLAEAATLIMARLPRPSLPLPEGHDTNGGIGGNPQSNRLLEEQNDLLRQQNEYMKAMHDRPETISLGDGKVMITQGSNTTIKKVQ